MESCLHLANIIFCYLVAEADEADEADAIYVAVVVVAIIYV
jgi:hypothetical protein